MLRDSLAEKDATVDERNATVAERDVTIAALEVLISSYSVLIYIHTFLHTLFGICTCQVTLNDRDAALTNLEVCFTRLLSIRTYIQQVLCSFYFTVDVCMYVYYSGMLSLMLG